MKQRHFSDRENSIASKRLLTTPTCSISLGRFHALITTSLALHLAVTGLTLFRDADHLAMALGSGDTIGWDS
jgi:hypothetical protein